MRSSRAGARSGSRGRRRIRVAPAACIRSTSRRPTADAISTFSKARRRSPIRKFTSLVMNQLDLKGRVAVITGGARGIGAAAARRALQSGATVAVWDVDGPQAEEARRELSALGTVTAEVV